MRRLLLSALAIVAIGVGWALAQTVVQQTLTGNETWQVGNGPAGPGYYTTAEALRGGQNYAIVPTGTTFTQVISPNVQVVIVTGAITTLNLSLPAAPFDQQSITVACPGGVATTVNMSVGVAQSASSLSGPGFTTCNSGQVTSMAATWIASVNNAATLGYTWNRIR